MHIFRIANPSFSVGGGEVRSYQVLKFLSSKAKITLVPPLFALCGKDVEVILKDIKTLNVKVPEKVIELSKGCNTFPKNPLKAVKIETDYYSNFIDKVKDADIVFTDFAYYFILRAMSSLKEKTKVKNVALIQAGNLKVVRSLRLISKIRGLDYLSLLRYLRDKYTDSVFRKYSKDLDLLLGVSKASIDDFMENKLVRKGTPWKVLKPANAFDESLLKYSTLDKEDYAVFFARLIPEKGLFELPKIWSKVREKLPNAKLVVLGKFFNEKYKRRFLSLIKGLGIEYKGFVSREELLKTVAKAKVVLNPTHYDHFSLTTLESLALKTPVVSYDIQAIKEIFGNQKAIKLVREFDVEGMAEKTVEVLREKDYSDWFDEEYEDFINLYKSWEKVADAEYNALKEFLDTAK